MRKLRDAVVRRIDSRGKFNFRANQNYMIKLGPEPDGILLKRADVLSWLPGLTRDQWKKIHPTLRRVYVPGGEKPRYDGQRPHYLKSEINTKLVKPLQEGNAA